MRLNKGGDMKGESTKGLQEQMPGTVRYYGHEYTGEIIGLGKTRVIVRFFLADGGARERDVPVTWDPDRFHNAVGESCFLPGRRARERRSQEETGAATPHV